MHSVKQEAIISADSMNGEVEYHVTLDCESSDSDHALTEAFRQAVITAVRFKYGTTPHGVSYLADLRTLRIVRF